jgi:hypothetical protein
MTQAKSNLDISPAFPEAPIATLELVLDDNWLP